MKSNIYWSVFKSLEKEFLRVAEIVHVDDGQLGVYSIHIAGLLIRTVVEIEALAKELYFMNGGEEPDEEKDLYFDTDCLKLLEDKFAIGKKMALVVNPLLYLEKEENLQMRPLHKSFKRGTSGANWAKAYQAVKHNRHKNLHRATLGNLLQALGALYILNLYYLDDTVNLGKDEHGKKLDASFGSELFAVKVHRFKSTSFSASEETISYKIAEDYDDCVYLIVPQSKTTEQERKLMKEIMDQVNDSNLIVKKINTIDPTRAANFENLTQEERTSLIVSAQSEIFQEAGKGLGQKLAIAKASIAYEAILNKNQYAAAIPTE